MDSNRDIFGLITTRDDVHMSIGFFGDDTCTVRETQETGTLSETTVFEHAARLVASAGVKYGNKNRDIRSMIVT